MNLDDFNFAAAAEESDLEVTLRRRGLIVRQRSDTLDQREELCENLLIILFYIMWKGVEGSSDTAWKVQN